MTGTAQTTALTTLLDLREADRLSVGVHVSAASGSNLIDLEESVDGINFVVVASLNISDPGTTIWHVDPVFSRWKKISYTPGTGSATFTVHINSRVDNIGARGVGPGVITVQ
jgi:type 1 fimbria pilin